MKYTDRLYKNADRRKVEQEMLRKFAEQQPSKSAVGDIKESDELYTPWVGGLINGVQGLRRTGDDMMGALAAQLAGWGANQYTGAGDIERYRETYNNNPAFRATAATPEEYEKRRLENPTFWQQVLGSTGEKSNFTREEAKNLEQSWMRDAEKPWTDKANEIENVRYTRRPGGWGEQLAVDVAANVPQLAEAALSGAAMGAVGGPVGATLGAGLSMAKNIYGQSYGDLRREGYGMDAAHGAALADTAWQVPFEYVGANRIFKMIPGLRRAFGKLSPQGKSRFTEWLKTVGSEGSTEFFQQYGDSSAEDIAAAIERGDFQKDYDSSRKAAWDIVERNTVGDKAEENLKEAAYAGLLGGIMGGGLGGLGQTVGYVNDKMTMPNRQMIEEAIAEEEARVAAEREQENGGNGGNANLHPNANAVAQFFINKGESPVVAAAIAGNVFQESGYDPTIENSIGAYGAFQYLGDRRDALLSFAEANNLDPSDLNTQLEFAWYEMNQEGTLENQALQEMRKAQTPEEAAVIFRRLFERPGEEEANDAARMEEARRVHDNFADAKAYIEDYAQTMDLASLEDEELQRTLNKLANEGTEEEVIQKAKELGYQPKVEETQEAPTEAPKEVPKPTERPQGAAQVSKIETLKEATQEAEAPTVEPIQGKPYHINNSTPAIKRDAGKGNFNNRGSYNGRLAPQNNTTAQTAGLPLTQPTQAIPQGENTNGENLQTQTTKRGENRENLDVNTEPKETLKSENNENATHPQGNEVTPTLAPSSRGVSNIAQNTPKTASDGNTLTADKVDGKALEKATAATADTVSAKSEASEAKAKENAALDTDSTVSMAKKIADERAQAVENGKETKAVAKKKLDDVEKKVKSRLDERLAKGEISKATHDKLADRAEDIKEEAVTRIEQTETKETPKKEETEEEMNPASDTTAKKSNKKTTQKTKDNDIIKKDNSDVKAKEETENVSERSEGLSGAVGVGRPGSGESESERSGNDAGRDSGNANRSGRRELRHDSGIDEQADNGKLSGNESGTEASTVDERNDSKGNEERGTEVPVISKKADKVEADIAKGKVKDPRDTQGNNYVPKDTKTESRSPKKRYQANVEAIKLLKKLEAENRKATPAEQEILAGYSGWGGLSFAFNNTSPQYDEAANAELRGLLTDVEYNDANGEVISAFYTPPFVINAMWNIATRLGFKGGRILDPGCGIANFFTYMPTDVQGNSTAMQGVEKSALPARIAAQLFQGQKFKINNTSYESMKTGNDFYDLAITNVPFAANVFPLDNSIKGKWNLHNYYFLKTLQKVRPNGLIIFMTSSNTMDASDSASVRRELSKSTELLGAIRLPTNLFGGAGAKVTTDIIVLRKLGENETNTERWGNAAKSANLDERDVTDDTSSWEAAKDLDFRVYANNYWNEHPENVIGKVTQHRDRYGRNAAFIETVSEDETRLLLNKAIESLPENVYVPRVPKQLNTKERVQQTLQPVSGRTVGDIVKMDDGKYGHVIVDNDTGSIFATPYEDSKQARIAAFMDVANAQSELMIAEVNGETTNEELDTLRQKLNKTYDTFVKKYGYLNDGTTAALVNEFPQVGRVLALENYKMGDGKKKSATATKADIFEKRVSFPAGYGVKVENAADALVASIQKFGFMDIPYMANELGVSEDNVISELGDKIIKDPADERYVTMDEYLSGNVRVKLAIAEDAAETDPSLKRNVEALKTVIPKDVEIKDIDTPLGTPIVSPEDTQAFLEDLLGEKESIEVSFNPTAGTWAVAKGRRYGSVPYSVSDREYGIPTINGNEKGLTVIDIVDAMLNDKDLSKREIFKNKNDDTPKMRDEREAAKQQEQNIREKIGQKFKEWIMANDEVSKTVKQAYNNKFNAFVTRKYDGSILDVKPTLHTLYPHQADAVFRIVSSKTTLLNHCVGSGKSLTMQSAGMELKRMGLANKIVYTLPKNVVTQFAREFYQDFPNARILVLSAETLPKAPKTITYDMVPKKDENGKPVKGINGEVVLEKVPTSEQEQARRRAIMARRNATLQKIKTNDWDAIVMSHTTFENVPVSDNYKLEFLNAEVDKYRAALEEERFKNRYSGKPTQTEKKLQESLERYERMIEEMLEGKEHYDLGEETFETLGIDHLFVDESDLFKNLGFVTNLSGVKGISTTGSMRAMDMFMKTKYLQEDTTTHGVTFATGTPISNSISELYTLCRYMAQRELDRLGINNFDQFAKLFVNIGQGEEPKTDGSGYDFKTKVIGIRNAPECIRIVSQFMDTKTVDDLPYIQAARPNANYKPVVIKEPNALKEFKKGLNARIGTFRGKYTPKVTSYSKESLKHFAETGEYLSVQDGFLKLVGDFRAITLCPYIVDKRLSGEEAFGKVWKCADNVYEEYLNSKDRKGAQVVFCDYSTPTKSEWSVYEELKNRLIEKGIPAKEIAFVHDAGTSDKKQAEIFKKVNEGTIRVIIGSTGKMGAGTNMQKKLVALHHLDVPWRPRDIEQREGRILRNGNENKDVNIYTYMTEGSYDMNLWNLLNSKQITINQAIHGDEAIRSADTEGIDENNFKSYEILANNDPNQKLYIQKTAELRRLEAQKSSFDSAKVAAENVLNTYPQKIERAKASLSGAQADAKYAETINKQFTINIGGKSYTRDEANEIFNKKKEVIAAKFAKELKENGNNTYLEEQQIATIGKAKVFVSGDTPKFRSYPASENTAVFVRLNLEYGAGTPTAIGAYNTVVGAPSKTLEELQDTIYSCQKEITLAKETLTKTFDKTEELAALREEVANLKSLIDGVKAKEATTAETETVKESTVGNIGEKLRHEATLIPENELTEREKGIVAFANKMGVKVQFFDGNKNLHGWQQGDVVFLNRNSAKDLNFVFWHEAFHWLAKNNPELYEKIKKAVLQNDDIAAQIEAYIEETGRTDLTVEETIEEMLADAMSEASKRGSFFETLGVTHPTLVQKIIKWIKNIYNDFVAQYRRTKGFRAEAGLTNTQIKRMSVALDGMALKLKDGQGNRLFRADGKGNLVSVGVKDVAYVDGVKYLVTNKNLRADDMVKVVYLLDGDAKDENVTQRAKRLEKTLVGKQFKLHRDNITVNADNKENAHHFVVGRRKTWYQKGKSRVLSRNANIKRLIENSVYVESRKSYHEEMRNSDYVKFYAVGGMDGQYIRFEIGAYKDSDGTYTVTSVSLYNLQTKGYIDKKAIKKGNLNPHHQYGGDITGGSESSFVSVADLLENVKDDDGNFYEREGKLQYEPSVEAEIQAEEKAEPTKLSINLKDLSDGKVFTDEKMNAANDTILQKMVIGNTAETKSFIDKYLGKRALPPLNPKVQYDEKAVNSKENLFRDHFSFTLLGAIRSVSRYKDAIVKQVFDWADTAKRQQAKLYAKWTVAHKEILDLIQAPKDYEMYTAILLDEDASRKVLTDDELRARGASDNVIKAHTLIRKLLKDIRSEVSRVYTAERAETKNFTSQAEAEAWAKTPFFRNVDIKKIKKTNGVVWQVKYLTPQYETNQARMTVEELEGLKENGDIKIISESLVDPNNPNYYDVEYMRPVRSLADLDFYIPHFFHDFLIVQTKKTKNGEEIKSVVGSGTSLEEAVERANALAEKAGANVSFEIAPKALACEDETSPAVIVGDKEYGMLTNSIKEGLSISLQEAQGALAARTTNRHVFLSALQHRKGAKGWETNMRWVIQHHIATSSRYCGLEPFKSKAINLFERRFGAFGDDYFTKSPRANFVQGYINSVLGRPSKMENFVNAMLNHLPGFKTVPRPSRAVTSTVLGAMSVFKLGVSPAAAVVNLTQLFNVQAYIGVQWTKEGMARAWKSSEADKKLLENLGTREETGLETVDVDEDTALVAGKYATQLKALRNAADKAMWAFTKAEAFLRKTAVLGAYHKAIAEGKTEGAARAYALEVNRKANFDYGIADAPGVFRATKGSIVGDLFLQFKKYGLKELEVIGDMLTNKNIPKSQRLAFFGEFFLLGGLFNSVPFQEVIVALIGMALDTDDPEAELKKWLMQKAGESEAAREAVLVGMYGAGALIGIDISQRVGFRTLVPEFDEPLGVTGSTAKQIVTAMANGDPIGFAKAVSPAAGNIASAAVGYNTDSKGRVSYVYENLGERVLRLCGFRTIGEALSVDTSRIVTEGRNKRANERKKAKEEYFKNPSRENKQKLKDLGYTDGQIKNLKPDDKTADRKTRLKNNMTKQELKDYDSILKW